MTLRYILYRLGANPDSIEIDEAIPLTTLYNKERGQIICPLLEIEP